MPPDEALVQTADNNTKSTGTRRRAERLGGALVPPPLRPRRAVFSVSLEGTTGADFPDTKMGKLLDDASESDAAKPSV